MHSYLLGNSSTPIVQHQLTELSAVEQQHVSPVVVCVQARTTWSVRWRAAACSAATSASSCRALPSTSTTCSLRSSPTSSSRSSRRWPNQFLHSYSPAVRICTAFYELYEFVRIVLSCSFCSFGIILNSGCSENGCNGHVMLL